MPKRGEVVSITIAAFDATGAVTGEASNITVYVIKDGTDAAGAGSLVESSNVPGRYKYTPTAAECNAKVLVVEGICSTSGVDVAGTQVFFEELTEADITAAVAAEVAADFTSVLSRLPAALVGGKMDIDKTSVSSLTAADVNAEVVDALNVDTYAEPAPGVPGATISLAAKIGYLFSKLRNRKTFTSSSGLETVFADDGSTSMFTTTTTTASGVTTKTEAE